MFRGPKDVQNYSFQKIVFGFYVYLRSKNLIWIDFMRIRFPFQNWCNCLSTHEKSVQICVTLESDPTSDFISFSGEEERLCRIFPREQAVRHHRSEYKISNTEMEIEMEIDKDI